MTGAFIHTCKDFIYTAIPSLDEGYDVEIDWRDGDWPDKLWFESEYAAREHLGELRNWGRMYSQDIQRT